MRNFWYYKKLDALLNSIFRSKTKIYELVPLPLIKEAGSALQIIYFCWSVFELHHLRSSINFGTFQRFLGSRNEFSLISSVKETPTFWKRFLYDVLTMVNQLEIPTYFLTLTCRDPRFEEPPYIIKKINNLKLSDKELKNLCYQERWNQLNNNQVSFEKNYTWWYTAGPLQAFLW